MEYELAKELKDNNFKTPRGIWFAEKMEYLPAPTLSELIEACGEDFDRLILRSPTINPFWEAYNLKDERERGKTPEESVARLWLGINKK